MEENRFPGRAIGAATRGRVLSLVGLGDYLHAILRIVRAEGVRLESRELSFGVRYGVCFTSKGMTSLPDFRAAFRALDIDCVHRFSLPEVFFDVSKARKACGTAR